VLLQRTELHSSEANRVFRVTKVWIKGEGRFKMRQRYGSVLALVEPQLPDLIKKASIK
jgi:hypothetical protein